MANTTSKLYMSFTCDNGKERTWSITYPNYYMEANDATALANAFIVNNTAFKEYYRPITIKKIWNEEVTKTYYIQ